MMTPPIRPKYPPLPNTWIGRYHAAWEWVENNLQGRKMRPLNVLVAGIGGGTDEYGQRYESAEPAEVGLALHRAGIRFSMTAMDVNAQAVEGINRQLKDGHLEFHEIKPPPALSLGRLSEPLEARWTYLGRLLGKPFESGRHKVPLPQAVKNAIKIRGPERKGDIFSNQLPRNNDLITSFNVAMYYDPYQQAILAKKLFDALRNGGILITHGLVKNEAYIEQLNALFGRAGRLHQMPSTEGGTIHVFKKTIKKVKRTWPKAWKKPIRNGRKRSRPNNIASYARKAPSFRSRENS